MNNELTVGFPSLSRNESLARGVAAQFVSLMDPTVEELSDVRTAVSEAVTNAIVHGYGGAGGTVTMKLVSEGDLFTVTVSDEGRGIGDIERAMKPFYTTDPQSERSGLGFSVMEAFMDSVSVVSAPGEGTSVTMKKLLRRE
ncbi:MAG: anti-sigma F factor [Clostridia bacterium]|nr:anti-sigma F factor [Clostridia bacterium]